MGETRDYLDAKRNAAIEEVQEILDELETPEMMFQVEDQPLLL